MKISTIFPLYTVDGKIDYDVLYISREAKEDLENWDEKLTMRVVDLSGREHSWNLLGCVPSKLCKRPRSEFHLAARKLLSEEFPLDQLLEEVLIPGESLYLDFYLPKRKIAIEVHGQQHYSFISHFHGTVANFIKAKNNDNRKKEWCEINGIQLLVLPYSESVDEWRSKFY